MSYTPTQIDRMELEARAMEAAADRAEADGADLATDRLARHHGDALAAAVCLSTVWRTQPDAYEQLVLEAALDTLWEQMSTTEQQTFDAWRRGEDVDPLARAIAAKHTQDTPTQRMAA